MDWWIILIVVIASLLFLFIVAELVIGLYVTHLMIHPYCTPIDEALEYDFKHNKITKDEFENDFKFEHYYINSNHGYKIKCSYIPKKINVSFSDGKERAVILSHGWTSNRFAMLVYAKMYLKLGFHVFLYDQRNHYESDKRPSSMGDFEADDLEMVIHSVIDRLGYTIIIGTHGESMGAATCMVHAGRYHSVDFTVEDCGYSSLEDLLKYQCVVLKHLPLFPTLLFARMWFKLLTKSSYSKVNPCQQVSTCDDIPMLFIHGDSDDFVPSYMVYKNYDAKNGFKMIRVYRNSSHAHSVIDHKEKYEKDLKTFLKKSKIID